MILLLDTHLLLWAAIRPDLLSRTARDLIVDPENELCFSAASIWEVAIKRSLGRSDSRLDVRRLWRLLLTHGYRELAVSGEHAIALEQLPMLHRDPFDRLLVAQARVEGLVLVTADAAVAGYGDPVRLV